MYLTIDDIKTGIYAETLNVLTRSETNVNQAITEAMEEVRGYLCARYDMEEEYAKTGASRNVRVFGIVRDIAIFNCFKMSNPANLHEVRQMIYKDCISSLQRIQAEKESILGLTRLTDKPGGGSNYIAYGGNKKRNNNW